jgi:hypothetical protein
MGGHPLAAWPVLSARANAIGDRRSNADPGIESLAAYTALHTEGLSDDVADALAIGPLIGLEQLPQVG